MPALPRIIALLTVACLVLCAGCNEKKLAATWCDHLINADGKSSDWDSIPRTVIEEPRVSVGVCNDSSHIYVLLHVNTANLVRAIENRGVTIWFDRNGKKKKTFGVSYQAGRLQNPLMEQQSPLEDDRIEQDDLQTTDQRRPAPIGLAVLYGSERNRIPIRAEEAGVPAAGFKREGRGYTCEFDVPLDSTQAEFAVGASPGAEISMGLMFGGAGPGMGHRRGGSSGNHRGEHGGGRAGGGDGGPGMGFPGGGMPGSGGMPGGHGKPDQSQARSDRGSAEPTEIWTKIVLALPAPHTK